MNLFSIFSEVVEKQPHHPLIIGPEDEQIKIYVEVYQHIQTLITQLKALGLKAGASVGLHYPSGPEYIYYVYAIWGCGACVVPVPVELTNSEKEKIFENICIDAVISKNSLNQIINVTPLSDPHPIAKDTSFMLVKPQREHPADFSTVNAAFIRFSSGTTGAAKGVVLSHETILERIGAANEVLQIGPDDRILWVLSMAYHFVVTIIAYLSYGASIIFCKNHFGSTIITSIIKHKATIIYGAPTHYALMTHTKNAPSLAHIRLAIATTTALAPKVAQDFHERFKKVLNETYGIIEVGLPCINTDNSGKKQGSVGRLLPAYDMHLEDIGQSTNLQSIYVRGVGILDAYYEPWQTREQILENNQGWFSTGDLGYFDDDGFLYIQGRSKEVISVGGMKFFPQEVETILETHPTIKEACVFAYPDKRAGEVPYAQIVKKQSSQDLPSEKEIKDFCSQYLASYKIPQKLMVVDTLTRTASGKLIRKYEKLIN